MRKRKSSEPPEEENTQSVGERKTVKAQVIRVVHISNVFWLCLGLVIGQLLVFLVKYQDSNPGVGQVTHEHLVAPVLVPGSVIIWKLAIF